LQLHAFVVTLARSFFDMFSILAIAGGAAVLIAFVIWRVLASSSPTNALQNVTVSRNWLAQHQTEDRS
jgi:NADH:ubiquinone oxidoreductase subunit 6 (subunit J)